MSTPVKDAMVKFIKLMKPLSPDDRALLVEALFTIYSPLGQKIIKKAVEP